MKNFCIYLVVFLAGLGLGLSIHRYALVTLPMSNFPGVVLRLDTLTGRTWMVVPVGDAGWSAIIPEQKRQTSNEDKFDLEIEIAVWCVIVTFFGLIVFLVNKMVWKMFGKPLKQMQGPKERSP